MTPDMRTVFLILVFAAVFAAGQVLWGLFTVAGARRAVNHRLRFAERVTNLEERVIELRKQRGEDALGRLAWGWLKNLIIRSGVGVNLRRAAIMIVVVAVVTAGGVAVASHNSLAALAAGLAAAIIGPLVFLKFKAGKRATLLAQQLPTALEIVVRSLEAGHPVPTAFSLVGRELPDPIGSEFGIASDEIAYGSTLEQAVGRMAERCQHPDIDLFAATIRLQERAGGNLTGLLKMNASTVRERLKMRLKIKAASSEGRISANILTAAPILVMGFLTVASPHYYGDVIHIKGIQIGLAVVGTWLVIGNLVMRRMIDMRI
jgi:tight adherence protein B